MFMNSDIDSNLGKEFLHCVSEILILKVVIGKCRIQCFQLSTDILQNACSEKFRKFYRKKPVLESLFNNACGSCFCVFWALK